MITPNTNVSGTLSHRKIRLSLSGVAGVWIIIPFEGCLCKVALPRCSEIHVAYLLIRILRIFVSRMQYRFGLDTCLQMYVVTIMKITCIHKYCFWQNCI